MWENWADVAIAPADILLPGQTVNLKSWAVVACDQYTSQPEYWHQVEQTVGEEPSTLRITLPEIYLKESAQRIPGIRKAMEDYLAQGRLHEAVKDGFILTERRTESGARLGLMVAADLESYDFAADSRSMIRATEGTILSRIPPRLAIREDACLECPHVMVLMDDIGRSVIEPIHAVRERLPLLYDFSLMAGGGHLRGWAVTEPELLHQVYEALMVLKSRLPRENPLLFAVGDGNHSLATARTHWLNLKRTLTPEEAVSHPARFALVEIENIHDEALLFEPIHRVVFHADAQVLLQDWTAYCQSHGMELRLGNAGPEEQAVGMVHGEKESTVVIARPETSLAVGTLQKFLDHWLAGHPEAEIDYIHGENAVRETCRQPETVGFLLPALAKDALLPAVRNDGALPRKTFSMGSAHEKRYYMESRKIK